MLKIVNNIQGKVNDVGFLTNDFNLKKIKEFCYNDNSNIYQILLILREKILKDIDALQFNIDPLNVSNLKSLTQKIKPNFQLLGLDTLKEFCDRIEKEKMLDVTLVGLVKMIISCLPEIVDKVEGEMVKI